jgi:thiamine biosynthesis protein ThiI
MQYDTVLVRYGEIGIKSEQVRRKYEELLIKNIKAMLEAEKVQYETILQERGRIYVKSQDPHAASIVSRVFGVVSTSPVVVTGPTIEEAAKVAAAIGKEVIKEGESYAINGRRAFAHPFTSQDIGRLCGDAVFYAVEDRHPRIDLKHPDHEIFVEIREDHSYIFTDIAKGVGGMPLGSQGKMVAMISGGIDSPVATWLMMKRGCDIIPVFFNNGEFSDKAYTDRAMETIKKLKQWAPGHEFKVYEVPHGDSLREFKERGNIKYMCVFCKHMMYKSAVEIAKKENAHGIVTGSSLGQVASQTSDNMLIEHYGICFPIYHPLIGLDKNEIVELARKIGTYDISTKPASCCLAVPRHPSIHGRLEEIERIEKEFDVKELADKELKGASITIL